MDVGRREITTLRACACCACIFHRVLKVLGKPIDVMETPCATCATCAISCGRKNFVWLGRLKLNERSGGAAETWDEPEFTIDTKVREFAEHLGCDPRVAQEAYDRMKVDWSLDGEIGRELRKELKGLEAIERSINRANYFMRLVPQEWGLLQLTSKLEGHRFPPIDRNLMFLSDSLPT